MDINQFRFSPHTIYKINFRLTKVLLFQIFILKNTIDSWEAVKLVESLVEAFHPASPNDSPYDIIHSCTIRPGN